MMPSPRDEGRRWIDEAAAELKATEYLQRGSFFNLACFHAQQAAEKAVKGFLRARGVEDPWGHSVGNLLADAGTYDATISPLQPLGASLDKFYIPTRYPNGLPGGIPSNAYTDREARDAFDMAKQVVDEMRRRVV